MTRCLEIIHEEQDLNTRFNFNRYAGEKGITLKRVLGSDVKNYPDHREYDLLFLHGGSQHLYDRETDPWLFDEIEYIKNAIAEKKMVFGVCLGSQLLAEALGGKVYECDEKEFGWYPVFLNSEGMGSPVMQGIEKSFVSMHWHSDHFTLPERVVSLAFTEVSPNQVFISLDYPAAAFQFHPEYQVEFINESVKTIEKPWSASRYVMTTEELLAMSESIPDTYPMFARIMDNVLLYFSKFNTE